MICQHSWPIAAWLAQRSGSCSWSRIGQGVFKRPAMQIQRHDKGLGERALGEIRQEEFVDHAGAGDANPTLGCPGRMSCHDHPAPHTLWSQGQIRAVVERAYYPTFRVGQVLIGRQFQASLDLGSLQDLIVFATHDIRESCQIGEDGSRAILPIQARASHALRGDCARFR